MTMMTSSHHLQFDFRSRPHCPPFRGIRVLENPKSISSFSTLLSFVFCSNSSPVICGGLHRSQFPRWLCGVSQSKATSESNVSTAASLGLPTASEVIRDFYDGINRRDLDSVELLIGVECVYEDLIFSKPFVGRKATMEFFKKFTESISSELQFVIDEISSEDTSSAGVTWHLEWRGRPFPFSKGCSFYRLEQSEGTRKIMIVVREGWL
ncbi:uncharacterized protein LOC110033988 isoform X2 [Phalaenopsis equestris]|uniref:uncharacterized protein LOC110033988 isoform X2 n=1 Tax=Phalaenopsis equestris TaxID=78828 RepID=UPI0009E5E8B6|nr:uncharacterized protein LOC110033988 isoform X2 [Phalaenopsis equestris]